MNSEDTVVRNRLRAATLQAWRVYCSLSRTGELLEDKNTLVANCKTHSPYYNGVVVKRELDNPEATIGPLVEYFSKQRLPFSLKIPSELDNGTSEIATVMGLKAEPSLPTMAMSIINARKRELPINVSLERVTTQEQVNQYIEICSQAFKVGLSDLEQLYSVQLFTQTGQQGYLARFRGQAAGTITFFPHGTTAFIADVTTKEEFRGRGLAQSLLRHCLLEASEVGCHIAGGDSAPIAEKFYARLGFHSVGSYKMLNSSPVD